jgi:hypothetical protein
LVMGDSVISATDNTVWKSQRNHMTEAFLPQSMAEIFPISMSRARLCKDILARLSEGGAAKVNLTEFFLNETQQQLHLALFGQDGENYDENYNSSFRDAVGGPPADARYSYRHRRARERQAMRESGEFEKLSGEERSMHPASIDSFLAKLNVFVEQGAARGQFASPIDVAEGRAEKVKGPLSAVLASTMGRSNDVQPGFSSLDGETRKQLNRQTDQGNALIFAFAGESKTAT